MLIGSLECQLHSTVYVGYSDVPLPQIPAAGALVFFLPSFPLTTHVLRAACAMGSA